MSWRPYLLHAGWWYLRKKGFLWTSGRVLWSVKYHLSRLLAGKSPDRPLQAQIRAEVQAPQLGAGGSAGGTAPEPAIRVGRDRPDEALNLQPGELVEVRSPEEIAETLDANSKYKGLWFMPEMYRYCGKKYRVYKRLENILLECTGEMRRVKNTVMLAGVICDGSEHFDCDRSCFHYWREVWLKRAEEDYL